MQASEKTGQEQTSGFEHPLPLAEAELHDKITLRPATKLAAWAGHLR